MQKTTFADGKPTLSLILNQVSGCFLFDSDELKTSVLHSHLRQRHPDRSYSVFSKLGSPILGYRHEGDQLESITYVHTQCEKVDYRILSIDFETFVVKAVTESGQTETTVVLRDQDGSLHAEKSNRFINKHVLRFINTHLSGFNKEMSDELNSKLPIALERRKK